VEFPRMKYARNWISIGGAIVTTLSAALFLIVFLLDALGFHTNPYIGIVVFLILPGFFVGGLAVIPIGMWVERRRQQSGRKPSKPTWPIVDLNNPVTRRTTMIVLVMTFFNVVIVSLAAYRGIEYMDSVPFCGQVCHTVMQPEYVAYQNGPHARVACVQCHIGSGAPWFVRSKLSGVRQVFAVAAHTYSRPIPSPVTNLRPARDTCEQCHWPAQFHGDKVLTLREYAEDEVNTESDTTLQLHVGGGGERARAGEGIHWHVNPGNKIEYWSTDDKRQVVARVRLTTPDGTVRVFTADGVTDAQLAGIEPRTMDCIDCHNRPTHTFAASAAKAADAAMADGLIATSLPYVKKETVALLTATYPTREQARDAIAAGLTGFYKTQYPDVYARNTAAIDRAVRATQDLYDRNVFPDMNITWGTYVNNIGHMDSPGCFRCHDDSHKTPGGETIKQDCELCHSLQ
jgi:nitrate/TMAO reductase-like tetraheme cytochrome c subunit